MRASKALALIAFYDFMVLYLYVICEVNFVIALLTALGVFIGTWSVYWHATNLED